MIGPFLSDHSCEPHRKTQRACIYSRTFLELFFFSLDGTGDAVFEL